MFIRVGPRTRKELALDEDGWELNTVQTKKETQLQQGLDGCDRKIFRLHILFEKQMRSAITSPCAVDSGKQLRSCDSCPLAVGSSISIRVDA